MKRGIFSKGLSALLSAAMVATMLVPGTALAAGTDYSSLLQYGGTLTGAKSGTTLTKTISEVGTSKDFDITLDVKGATGTPQTTPTDIVLVLDTSGSMSGTDIANEKKAANDFLLDVLGSDVTAAVVRFSSTASVYSADKKKFVGGSIGSSGLTLADATGDSYFSNSIDKLGAYGGKNGTGATLSGALSKLGNGSGATFTQQGLMYADALLKTRGSAHNKVAILMSDGVPNYSYRATNTASVSPAFSLGGTSYDFYATAFQYADTGTGNNKVRARLGDGRNFSLGSSYTTPSGKTVSDSGLAVVSQATQMHGTDGISLYTVGYGIDGLTVKNDGGTTQQATDTLTRSAAYGGGSFYKADKGSENAQLLDAFNKIKNQIVYGDATVTDAIDENVFTYVGFVENGKVVDPPSQDATHTAGGSINWNLPGYSGAETSITYRVTLKDTAVSPASSGTHTVAGSGATTLGGTAITSGTQPYVTVGTGSVAVVNYLVNAAGVPISPTTYAPTTGSDGTAKILAAQLGSRQNFTPLNLGSTVYSTANLSGYQGPGSGYAASGASPTAKLTLDSPAATLYVPYTLSAGAVTIHFVDAGGTAIPGIGTETLSGGKAGDGFSAAVSSINGHDYTTISTDTAAYQYAGHYKIGAAGSSVTNNTITGTYTAGAQDVYVYYAQTTGTVYVHHYRANSSGAPVDANGNTKDSATGAAYTESSAAVQLPNDSVYKATVAVGSAFGPGSAGYDAAVPGSIASGTTAYTLVPKSGGYTSGTVPADGGTVSLYVPYTLNANAVIVHFVDGSGTQIASPATLPAGKLGDPFTVMVSGIGGTDYTTISTGTASYQYSNTYRFETTGAAQTGGTVSGSYTSATQNIYLVYTQTTGTVYVHHYRVNSNGDPVDANGNTKDPVKGKTYVKSSTAVQLPNDSIYTATVAVSSAFGPASAGYGTAVPASIGAYNLVPKNKGYTSSKVGSDGKAVNLYVPYNVAAGTVTVHYVDAGGNALPGIASEALPAGKVGDPIALPVTNVNGSDRTNVSNATATYAYQHQYSVGTGARQNGDTVTGTYLPGNQDLYLYYGQTTGTVYVHHYRVNSSGDPVDKDGNTADPVSGTTYTRDSTAVQLPDDTVYPISLPVGSVFDSSSTGYNTAVPGTIGSYTLVAKAGGYTSDTVPANGSAVHLYVPYTIAAGAVTVHYVDAGGNALPGIASEDLPAGNLGDPIALSVTNVNGSDRTTVSNATSTYSYDNSYRIGAAGSRTTGGTVAGTYIAGTQDIYLFYNQSAGTVYIHHYRANSGGQPVDKNGNTRDGSGNAYAPADSAVQLPDDTVYTASVPVGSAFDSTSAGYGTAVPGSIMKGTTEYDLIPAAEGYASDAVPGTGGTVSLYVPYRQNTSVSFSFVDRYDGSTIQADVTVPAAGPAAVGDPFRYDIPATIQYNGYTYTYAGTLTGPITGTQTPEAQHFTLEYKKNVSVTILYHDVDDPGAAFAPKAYGGYAGTSYTVPGVTGYEQVVREGSPTIGGSYAMANENQTFDVYLRKGSYAYTVYYYLNDDPFTPFKTYAGPATVLGGQITSVPDYAPDGYQLDASQSTALPLTITADPEQNVIYIYYGITPLGTVTNITVHYYLKGTTTQLRADRNDTGFVGDAATYEAPAIKGYTVSGPSSITLRSLEPLSNIVTFYYTKDSTGTNTNTNTNGGGTVNIPDNQTPLAGNPDTGDPYASGLLLPVLASLLTAAGLKLSRILRKARRGA